LINEPVSVLITNKVLPVQRKESLGQVLRSAGHTTGGVVNIRYISETPAGPQTELGSPQTVLDDPLAQSLGVVLYGLLQAGDFAMRIVERNADVGLAEYTTLRKP